MEKLDMSELVKDRERMQFDDEKTEFVELDVSKEEYLKLKNNNKDPNKHSFQLFYETINNVYNHY